MRSLMAQVSGTSWELIVVLGGLYGLRISEIIGLRWRNVNLEERCFEVVEQMPYSVPNSATSISEMAPVKAGERTLPITEMTLPYFERQLANQNRQRALLVGAGGEYYENDLVIAKPDGAPERRSRVSANFGQLLRHLGMPHIRFHDTRHSAATNMYQLTGDFYAIGAVLGHSLKGVGIQLGISDKLDAVTAQYIDVRMDRKKVVLDTYHQAVLGCAE
jgi:integrase